MCNLIMIYNVVLLPPSLLMRVLHMWKFCNSVIHSTRAEIIDKILISIALIWIEFLVGCYGLNEGGFWRLKADQFFFIFQSESATTENGSSTSSENDIDIEMEMKKDPQAITVPITVCVAIMIGYVTAAEIAASSCWN